MFNVFRSSKINSEFKYVWGLIDETNNDYTDDDDNNIIINVIILNQIA
jgi:hypothetical protein